MDLYGTKAVSYNGISYSGPSYGKEEPFESNCSSIFRRSLKTLGMNIYKNSLFQVILIYVCVKFINHYFKYDYNIAYLFLIYFITLNSAGILTVLNNEYSNKINKITMRHPFIIMIIIIILSFFIYNYLNKNKLFII